MQTVGDYLKNCREAQNNSLNDIANTTKISRIYLESLEKNEYDKIPAKPYVKGYIASYAACLGLDQHEALRLYDAFENEINDSEEIAIENTQGYRNSAPSRRRFINKAGPVFAVGILLVLSIGLYNLFFQKPKPAVPTQIIAEQPDAKQATSISISEQPETKRARLISTSEQPEAKQARLISTPAQPETKQVKLIPTPARPEAKQAKLISTPEQPETKPAELISTVTYDFPQNKQNNISSKSSQQNGYHKAIEPKGIRKKANIGHSKVPKPPQPLPAKRYEKETSLDQLAPEFAAFNESSGSKQAPLQNQKKAVVTNGLPETPEAKSARLISTAAYDLPPKKNNSISNQSSQRNGFHKPVEHRVIPKKPDNGLARISNPAVARHC